MSSPIRKWSPTRDTSSTRWYGDVASGPSGSPIGPERNTAVSVATTSTPSCGMACGLTGSRSSTISKDSKS